MKEQIKALLIGLFFVLLTAIAIKFIDRKFDYDCNRDQKQEQNIVFEVDKILNDSKSWNCKIVKDCDKYSDWRYDKPEDKCEYEYKIIESYENPVEFESYGGYCEEVENK